MKIIDEREAKSIYEVAYECGDNLIKVVRVNSKKHFSKNRSALEIQKVGLDFHTESLEFEEGVVHTHYKQGLGHSSMIPDLDSKDERAKQLLEEYAGIFNEVFANNEKLQGYLPSDFTQLQEYLPSFDAESQVVVDDSE